MYSATVLSSADLPVPSASVFCDSFCQYNQSNTVGFLLFKRQSRITIANTPHSHSLRLIHLSDDILPVTVDLLTFPCASFARKTWLGNWCSDTPCISILLPVVYANQSIFIFFSHANPELHRSRKNKEKNFPEAEGCQCERNHGLERNGARLCDFDDHQEPDHFGSRQPVRTPSTTDHPL